MGKDDRNFGYSYHEMYIIDRNPETLKFKFTKLMDCRYASLCSVEE